MGVGNCFNCKVEKSEDYIISNLYNGIIAKNIDYRELYKKLDLSKYNLGGSENIIYNDFKDAITKFYPINIREYQTDLEKIEILNFNETVLFDVYNFIHSSNRNNFNLLLLIMFPLCSRSLKNKQLKITELFKLIKKSTLEEKVFLTSRSKDSNNQKKKSENDLIIYQWANDPMRIQSSVLETNLSFYISTIIVGYSLPIKNFFHEKHFSLQYDEMVKIARSYFNSYYLKKFFLCIMKEFQDKIFREAKSYDIHKDEFYVHHDDFSSLIENNIFLLDFAETRKKFFDFVEN